MDVLLLGTGAPDSPPVAFCGCPVCRDALAIRQARAAAAALFDGVLLVGDPVDVGLGAGRLGVDLSAAARSADGYTVREVGRACSVHADGRRVLWAPAGVDPAAVSGEAYDAVFLHLGDGSGFGALIEELRRGGTVGDATQVIALGPSHRVDAATAAAAAAAARARLADDGEIVPVGGQRGRRTLVLGGARSGKSEFAERLVGGEPAVTYVATALDRPDDPEWQERVARHRARRPASWTTVETTEVAAVLRDRGGALLVDCFSLWLAAALDSAGAWEADRDDSDAVLGAAVDDLVDAFLATSAMVVGVSSEVGLGVVPATAAGRRYRDDLGRLNARLAAAADEVWLVTAGLPRRLK